MLNKPQKFFESYLNNDTQELSKYLYKINDEIVKENVLNLSNEVLDKYKDLPGAATKIGINHYNIFMFPNDEIYNDHIHNLILVTTSVSPSMQVFNKISLFLSNSTTVINIITFFHYIIMYNDLQYKIVFMDLAPWEKTDKYISYEPAHRIHYNDIDTEEDININIICNKHTSAKPGSFYAYFYIVYWILSTILIYFIYKMYAKSSISKSNINKNIRPVRNVRRR